MDRIPETALVAVAVVAWPEGDGWAWEIAVRPTGDGKLRRTRLTGVADSYESAMAKGMRALRNVWGASEEKVLHEGTVHIAQESAKA